MLIINPFLKVYSQSRREIPALTAGVITSGVRVCVKTPALTAHGGRGSPYPDESPRPETEPRLSEAVEADFSHTLVSQEIFCGNEMTENRLLGSERTIGPGTAIAARKIAELHQGVN
jgi:hypothetical protein